MHSSIAGGKTGGAVVCGAADDVTETGGNRGDDDPDEFGEEEEPDFRMEPFFPGFDGLPRLWCFASLHVSAIPL